MQIILFALGPPTGYSRWALGDSACILKIETVSHLGDPGG